MSKIISRWGESRTQIFALIFILVFGMMVFDMVFVDNNIRVYVPNSDAYDVSYNEVVDFLRNDNISEHKYIAGEYVCYNFAVDTVYRANEKEIRCAYVVIPQPGGAIGFNHAIIGFNTTDMGMVYFEPQTDTRMFPKDILYEQWR